MKQTEHHPGTLAIRSAMDAFEAALDREVPMLESGLDIAFTELRAARMAILAPWADDDPDPVDAEGLSERIAELVGPIMADRLKCADWGDVAPDGDVCAPTEVLKNVQKRTSGPMGAMLSALQVRDEMSQRMSHLTSMLADSANADAEAQPVLSSLMGTQARALIQDLSDRAEKVAEKSVVTVDAVADSAGPAFSSGVTAVAPFCAVIADAFGRTLSLYQISDSAPWREMISDILKLVAPDTVPRALSHRLSNTMASMVIARASVRQIIISANALSPTAESLPIDAGNLNVEHPLMDHVWRSYTVDAEREAHTRLVQRQKAA